MAFQKSKFAAVIAATGILALAPQAIAQDVDGWAGEGSLSAGTTSGNTETTDLGLGVDMARKAGIWTYGVEAAADYGEIDGFETRNRYMLAGNIDRLINDRLFGFGRVSYESDQFTGFDSRAFVGGGLGYSIYDNDTTTWSVRGGPGVKIDEVRTTGETETSFGAVARSEFGYAFNENVSLSNNTDVLYSEESTQLSNSIGVTAALSGALSARVSFDVRYDTNPPIGFEDTDTATKIALVYGFGK